MLSTSQKGNVQSARKEWDNDVAPTKADVAAGGSAALMVERQSTWAGTDGIVVLEFAEWAIEELERCYAKIRELGGDPS